MTKKKVLKLSSLRVDIKREREGEWVTSKQFEGISYQVRSTNSPEYVSAQQKSLRAIQVLIRDNKPIDQDKLHADEARIVVQYLLLAWKGLDEEFSEEVALTELVEPAARPLLNDIIECASRVGRNELEYIEQDAKN
jgi:hypothetical protein